MILPSFVSNLKSVGLLLLLLQHRRARRPFRSLYLSIHLYVWCPGRPLNPHDSLVLTNRHRRRRPLLCHLSFVRQLGRREAGGCAGRRKASSGAAYSPAGRSVRPADEGCRERATASGGGGASSGSGESFLSPSRYFCESELSQLRNCAPSVEAGREGRRGCLGPSRRLFGRGEEEAEREKEGEGREGSARLHTDSVRSSTLFEWRRRRLKLADGRLAR